VKKYFSLSQIVKMTITGIYILSNKKNITFAELFVEDYSGVDD